MKRTERKLPAILLATGMLLLAACGQQPAGDSVTQPNVKTVQALFTAPPEQDTVAMETDEGELLTVSLADAEITDEKGAEITQQELLPGMRAALTTQDGAVEKPATLHVTGEDALCALYMQVMRDLWVEDDALQDDISLIAIDLTEAENLTEGQKNAVQSMAQQAFGMATVQSTFDKLSAQGLIDKENLYFPSGVLFRFSNMRFEDMRFVFEAEKWRSGLGAIFFTDCTAEKIGDSWSYTPGGFAIS